MPFTQFFFTLAAVVKKTVLLFCIAGVLFSCNKDENPKNSSDSELIGEWKLIETYVDPGGGGSFETVDAEKTITFHDDGTITSNGDLCSMSIEANNPTSGTFSVVDSTFTSPDCDTPIPDYDFRFEQNGNVLIIDYSPYPCLCSCRAKYIK
jgi:hypothetical protein